MAGVEWIVEAHGCPPDGLRDLGLLRELFRRLIEDLELHTVGEILWHQFPHTGGITGLALAVGIPPGLPHFPGARLHLPESV